MADSGRANFLNASSGCAVLIAADQLLPALEEHTRTPATDVELITFADTDALLALETISRRQPRLVMLEKGFAETSRGAALINRLKADPKLAQVEIRIVARKTAGTPDGGMTAPLPGSAPAVSTPGGALDYRGTRRAPRYKMAAGVETDINGKTATVIDISTIGAQVVSPTILKPNQRVRVTLSDEQGQVRCQAVVAWAAFEMPPESAPHYRAGLQFLDADPKALDAFRVRHQNL